MMPVSFEKLRKYPHMMPNDIGIWERFIEQYPDRFDVIEYDVHVGAGRGYHDYDPEWKIRLAKAITQFRIDAVGWIGPSPTIVEVKPYAGLSALGQLKAYSHYFTREFPQSPLPFLMIVTDETLPEIVELYEENKIEVIQVGSP